MIYKISEKAKYTAAGRALSIILALALVFGALVPGLGTIKAGAAGTLNFSESYNVKVSISVTNDADGWNSASCKIYAKEFCGTGPERKVQEYDIKSSIDDDNETWTVTESCGHSFPSKVVIYTDFGGGVTWREWGADVNIYVNDVNVKSAHLVVKSSIFSSSDQTDTLTIDKIHYPYPKTINVLNHHPDIEDMPAEENFNEFFEDDTEPGRATGNIFINACDVYGVNWYADYGAYGAPDDYTNDSGDGILYGTTGVSAPGVSPGIVYKLYSTKGTDHKSTYTFIYETGCTGHETVTKQVSVYYYFKHTLTVKVNNQAVFTERKFKGDFSDLNDVPMPDGYTLNGFDKTGEGTYDHEARQFTYGDTDAVLTAALKANKYKIAFDGNGATLGRMTNKTATYGTPLQLPANSFSREDNYGAYKFAGWNTKADGSGTAISNRGFAISLTPVSGETVTLYAQWNLIGWNLTLRYPEEMGIPEREVAVSKEPGLNYFEPEQYIDTGADDVHYVYVPQGENLSDINSNMTVDLLYVGEGHNMTSIATTVPPTCPSDGNLGYGEGEHHCTYCGQSREVLLPPLNHEYSEPEWDWELTYSAATAKFTCTRCGDIQRYYTETSCSDNENTRTYTASVQFGGRTYTDTKEEHINHIFFDLNGGSGSLTPVTVIDCDYELPGLHPSSYMPLASFKGWLIGDKIYQPGEYIEAGDFTAIAQWEIGWSEIQRAVDGGATSITLGADVVAGPEDGPIIIPSGKTVNINLNGHKIDRNLDAPVQDGSVIKITGGTLNLTDSKGTGMVTGGNTAGNGGGIYVESGTLNLASTCNIAFNRAAGNGGGVYVESGRLSMSGGLVTDNICGGNGGGIYVDNASAFEMSYTSEVSRNACVSSNPLTGGVYINNITNPNDADDHSFKVSDAVKICNNYSAQSDEAVLADGSASNLAVNEENSIKGLIWYQLEPDALICISGEPGYAYIAPSDGSVTVELVNFRSDSIDYEPALEGGNLVFAGHTHFFGEPVWTWADDFSSASAEFTCTGCGYTETVEATVNAGSNNTHFIYTASAVSGEKTYTDEKRSAKTWNISVAGVPVNGDNCGDVLGDGTVSYNVNTNTLTLTNAVIEMSTREGVAETFEYGIRYNVNRGTSFKIVLNGENRIVDEIRHDDITRKYGIAMFNSGGNDCKPTISGSGSLEITMAAPALESSDAYFCGIHSSGSVTTINGPDIRAFIEGQGPSEGIHCNDKLVITGESDVKCITGANASSKALYAKSLDMAQGTALELVSGGSAVASNCALTEGTAALGAMVNTLNTQEGKVRWDGTTALSSYKYVSIPAEGEEINHFISCSVDKSEVIKGEYLTWTVVTSDEVTWLRLNGSYTPSGGIRKNISALYKSSSTGANVSRTADNGIATWVIRIKASYTGEDSSVLQSWTVSYKAGSDTAYTKANEDSPASVTVYKDAEAYTAATQVLAAFTLVSASVQSENVTADVYAPVTIVTTSDCTKVRIGTGGKFATYQTTTKNNVFYVDDPATGLRTWTVNYKFKGSGPAEYTVNARGSAWGTPKTFTVNIV